MISKDFIKKELKIFGLIIIGISPFIICLNYLDIELFKTYGFWKTTLLLGSIEFYAQITKSFNL